MTQRDAEVSAGNPRNGRLLARIQWLLDPASWQHTLLLLLVYCVLGVIVNSFNKWLVSEPSEANNHIGYGLRYPVLIVLALQSGNFVLCALLCSVGFRHLRVVHCPNWTSVVWYLRYFGPVGTATGLAYCFTVLSLRFASISFVETVRSFVPAVVLLNNFRRGRDKHPVNVLIVIGLSLGVSLTVAAEHSDNEEFREVALLSAIAACLLEAAHLLLLERVFDNPNPSVLSVLKSVSPGGHHHAQQEQGQRLELAELLPGAHERSQESGLPGLLDELSDLDDDDDGDDERRLEVAPVPVPTVAGAPSTRADIDPVKFLLFYSPMSALAVLPALLAVEADVSKSDRTEEPLQLMGTIALLLLGSVLNCAFSLCELYALRKTSALTLCVAAVLKLLGMFWVTSSLFKHKLSPTNKLGIGLCLLSVLAYNLTKYFNGRAAAARGARPAAQTVASQAGLASARSQRPLDAADELSFI